MSRRIGPTPTKNTTPVPDLTDGLCIGHHDPELWAWLKDGERGTSTTSAARIRAAQDLCHRCPVRAGCLDWRLNGPTRPAGVHGGELFAEGAGEPVQASADTGPDLGRRAAA